MISFRVKRQAELILQILKTDGMVNYLHHLGFDAYIQISINACLDAIDVIYLSSYPSYLIDQLPENLTEFGLGLREENKLNCLNQKKMQF